MVSLSEQIKTLQGFSPDLFIYLKIKDNKLWMLLIQIFGRNFKLKTLFCNFKAMSKLWWKKYSSTI